MSMSICFEIHSCDSDISTATVALSNTAPSMASYIGNTRRKLHNTKPVFVVFVVLGASWVSTSLVPRLHPPAFNRILRLKAGGWSLGTRLGFGGFSGFGGFRGFGGFGFSKLSWFSRVRSRGTIFQFNEEPHLESIIQMGGFVDNMKVYLELTQTLHLTRSTPPAK